MIPDVWGAIGTFAAYAQRELSSINVEAAVGEAGRFLGNAAVDTRRAVDNIDLDQARKHVEQFVSNAAGDVSKALSEIDINKAATDVHDFFDTFGRDVSRAVISVDWARIPGDAEHLFIKHGAAVASAPTIFYVTSGLVFLVPGIVTVPVLQALGFTPIGPAAGSLAATYQAALGPIVAGSIFATLQSAAMGGQGLAAANGLVKLLAITGAAGTGILDALNDNQVKNEDVQLENAVLEKEL